MSLGKVIQPKTHILLKILLALQDLMPSKTYGTLQDHLEIYVEEKLGDQLNKSMNIYGYKFNYMKTIYHYDQLHNKTSPFKKKVTIPE